MAMLNNQMVINMLFACYLHAICYGLYGLKTFDTSKKQDTCLARRRACPTLSWHQRTHAN